MVGRVLRVYTDQSRERRNEEDVMRVALLGAGTMGAGMARSLLRAGLEVAVWNRSAGKATPLADDGATVAADTGRSGARAPTSC